MYKCIFCPKSFARLSELSCHKEFEHSDEKPFKCDYCEKCFSIKSQLARHHRTHTGEKPYKCQKCDQSFSQSYTLKRHEISHTGERPFECQHCSHSFSRLDNFIIHQRTHAGEKSFKCQECEKSFCTYTELRIHNRIHTEKKPHKCPHCNKSFVHLSSLKYHHRTHPEEEPNKCSLCDKTREMIKNLVNQQNLEEKLNEYKNADLKVRTVQKFYVRKESVLKKNYFENKDGRSILKKTTTPQVVKFEMCNVESIKIESETLETNPDDSTETLLQFSEFPSSVNDITVAASQVDKKPFEFAACGDIFDSKQPGDIQSTDKLDKDDPLKLDPDDNQIEKVLVAHSEFRLIAD